MKNEIPYNSWKYTIDDVEYPINWNLYEDSVNYFSAIYPKDWEVNNQELAMFCVMPDAKDINEYSIFVIHNMENLGLDLNGFLKAGVNSFITDINSPVLWYDIQELKYNSLKVYELDIVMLNNDKKYLIKNIFFNDENNIYDFSNKMLLEDNNQLKYTTFIEMIKSVEFNNHKVLGERTTFDVIRHCKIEDI